MRHGPGRLPPLATELGRSLGRRVAGRAAGPGHHGQKMVLVTSLSGFNTENVPIINGNKAGTALMPPLIIGQNWVP
jgi:hypothetical protein